MASNLSTIGFDLKDNAALQELVIRLANAASTGLSSPVGDYVIWRSRTGAEIWFHLTPNPAPKLEPGASPSEDAPREIIGLTPFFEGRNRTAIRLTSTITRPNDNAFEGAFCAWVAPPPAANAGTDEHSGNKGLDHHGPDIIGSEEGSYPLVFDCVDYAVHCDRILPANCWARLTGFARELRIFTDEEAFEAAQPPENGFAPQSFFPVGLFAASDAATGTGQTPPPSSNALFNGRIVDHQLLTNEETDTSFYWLAIETLDATFDVVAHPNVVKGQIANGAFAQAACWMFGRLLED